MTRDPPHLLPEVPDVASALSELCRQIPPGSVSTFGDLAEALGDRHAALWAATQWSQWNSIAPAATPVPWHRVIRKTGELPRASAAIQDSQRELLAREGFELTSQGVLKEWRPWCHFETTRPLKHLAEWQVELARQANDDWPGGRPRIIAGVDTSYGSPTEAVAAYVAIDGSTGEVVDRRVVQGNVEFPYISGYLAFRELPLLLKLMQHVEAHSSPPDLVLVDGAGRLHPRRCGLAVLFGLLTGLSSVGVAKHRLCGRLRDHPILSAGRPIWDGEEWLGIELSFAKDRRHCDISVGHQIDLSRAGEIVAQLGTDLSGPLPVVLADQWSRSVVRQIKNPRPRSIEG